MQKYWRFYITPKSGKEILVAEVLGEEQAEEVRQAMYSSLYRGTGHTLRITADHKDVPVKHQIIYTSASV